MSFNLDFDSLDRICENRDEIAVFGFQHCLYTPLSNALEKRVTRIYDCAVGNQDLDLGFLASPRTGRRIQQIDTGADDVEEGSSKYCSRNCKASLVNIVVENYRREQQGEAIIPILFCIDKKDNHTPLTSENLLTKTKVIEVTPTHRLAMNEIITHCELRRSYKLCNDEDLPEVIRDVANRSFKFVRVIDTRHKEGEREEIHLSLEHIEAPWRTPDFNDHLAERKSLSVTPPPLKDHDWRRQVTDIL